MEGAERGPLRVTNVPPEECEPFDIDVLCAKLEVAKLEREEQEAASLLRKQVREAVRKSEGEHARSMRRKPVPPPSLSIDPNKNTSQTSLSENARSTPYARYCGQNLSWSNVNLSIPEHRAIDATVYSPPAEEREEMSNVIVSRSTSANDGATTQATPTKSIKSPSRRSPFALFKNLTSDGATPTRTRLAEDRPDDIAKRRSVSSPYLETNFNKTELSLKQPIDSTRASLTNDCKFNDKHHSIHYVSEYAVCFDTSPTQPDFNEDRDPMDALIASPLPIERPHWTSRGNSDGNEATRSFLNLPSMLRKDRREKQTRSAVEEVVVEEPPPLPLPPVPLTAAEIAAGLQRSRPHTQSNTVPEGLICEAVRRIEEQQRQQQSLKKKRRSMGALLQTILLPNHHGVSGATHCVAI